MHFKFQPMNRQFAREIAFDWHYPGEYGFYDMFGDGAERFSSDKSYWQDTILACVDTDERLVGFVSFTVDRADCWLALGLHPTVTGKGIGESFVKACIEYARNNHKMKNDRLKLLVACFNQRAIKVYQRVGFKITGELERETHIGIVNFLEMAYSMPKQHK